MSTDRHSRRACSGLHHEWQEASPKRRRNEYGKSVLLRSFRQSFIDENLHVDTTVQRASLRIGIRRGRMCRAVACGDDDPAHGDIPLLDEIVCDGRGAILAELLIELLCSRA